MARQLTEREIKRLEELNQKCIDCIQNSNADYQGIDRDRCNICPTGIEIHKFDQDNVDGYNSGRYEKYFTA